jgi:hypothetical protein
MTDNSGVTKFVNPTNKYHFTGWMTFEEKQFEYDILLTPFNLRTKQGREAYKFVVDNISKRKRDGKPCLGIDETTIRDYLDRKTTSAYGFVRTRNKQGFIDEASGSIQLYNWCKNDKIQRDKQERDKLQAWLGDLCRVSEFKSTVSPTKALLSLLEQLVVQNTELREMHLMIEPDEREILGRIYENYGFRIIRNCLIVPLIPMKKRIIKNNAFIGFPFI